MSKLSILRPALDQDKWIAVNLQRDVRIVAIAMQGDDLGNRNLWVTTFTVKYKVDESSQFIDVMDENSNPIVSYFEL